LFRNDPPTTAQTALQTVDISLSQRSQCRDHVLDRLIERNVRLNFRHHRTWCRSDEAPSNRAPAAVIRNSEIAPPNCAHRHDHPRKPTPDIVGNNAAGATTDNSGARAKNIRFTEYAATKRSVLVILKLT